MKIRGETVSREFWACAQRYTQRIAIVEEGGRTWNWSDLSNAVREAVGGLMELGVRKGDRVGIWMANSPIWEIADFAIATLGAVSVPIHENLPEKEAFSLLARAKVKITLTAASFQMDDLRRRGRDFGSEQVRRCLLSQSADDPHTILFTSGSMGEPKGVVLTNRNFLSVLKGLRIRTWGFTPTVSIRLPLSHVFQRTALYRQRFAGWKSVYPSEETRTDKPSTLAHGVIVVPRILEKWRSGILEECKQAPPVTQEALRALLESRELRINLRGRFHRYLLRRRVGPLVRHVIGRRLRLIACGSAALDPEVERFFLVLGIPIFQGYGLTETTAPVAANTPGHRRTGTVGRALPGVEIRIAPDGEVCVRGESIFKEYLDDPAATAEAFPDGWFHTGDLGELDGEGYLRITGRKKELIVLSTGKKVSPALLEAALRQLTCVEQALVAGEGKSYLVALLFPGTAGIPSDPRKTDLEIQTFNSERAPHERVRRFRWMEEPLSVEKGELTPTLKIRRPVLLQHFAKVLTDLYLSGSDETTVSAS